MPDADLTPHGRLIEEAREERLVIKRREAARRAGISESRWRQIVTGYYMANGQRVPVNPSLRALIAMAIVTEVDPWEVAQAARLPKLPERQVFDRLVREVGEEIGRPVATTPAPTADGDQLLVSPEEKAMVLSDPHLSPVQRARVLRLLHERRARRREDDLTETRMIIDAMGQAG